MILNIEHQVLTGCEIGKVLTFEKRIAGCIKNFHFDAECVVAVQGRAVQGHLVKGIVRQVDIKRHIVRCSPVGSHAIRCQAVGLLQGDHVRACKVVRAVFFTCDTDNGVAGQPLGIGTGVVRDPPAVRPVVALPDSQSGGIHTGKVCRGEVSINDTSDGDGAGGAGTDAVDERLGFEGGDAYSIGEDGVSGQAQCRRVDRRFAGRLAAVRGIMDHGTRRAAGNG